MANRPKVGGFPFLAECMRQAGVRFNHWALPSAQSIYVMADGVVAYQGSPLISGMADVPAFDEAALIAALRTDQAGWLGLSAIQLILKLEQSRITARMMKPTWKLILKSKLEWK